MSATEAVRREYRAERQRQFGLAIGEVVFRQFTGKIGAAQVVNLVITTTDAIYQSVGFEGVQTFGDRLPTVVDIFADNYR